MSSSNKIGAELRSQLPIPTIDLATIVEKIVASIGRSNSWLLIYDKDRNYLSINFNSILNELGKYAELISIPSTQLTNKSICVGGQIAVDSELRLNKALDKLQKILTDQFITLLSTEQLSPDQFIASNLKEELTKLSKQVGGYTDRLEAATTRIQSTQFVTPSKRPPKPPLARIISAMESTEVGNRLETMLEAIRCLMQQQTDLNANEITKRLQDIQHNYKQDDTQLQQFISLLDDDKFTAARLRSAVALEIMDIIQLTLQQKSDDNSKLATEYIRRVVAIYREFVELNHQNQALELELNLESHYGLNSGARFLLAEELNKIFLYQNLPIWCHWQLPLLETIAIDKGNIQRHIGYRFRVNGKDPEYQKSSYELRLRRLKEALIPKPSPPKYSGISQPLAQLLFLAVVIPSDDHKFNVDVIKKLRDGTKFLNEFGQNAVDRILNNLTSRINTVRNIEKAVVKILKTQGSLFSQRIKPAHHYYLNVLPGILNKPRTFDGSKEILIKPGDNQNQRAVWYNHIQITSNTPLPNALFSIKTDVVVYETLLCANDNPSKPLMCHRIYNDVQMMQIIWQPITSLNQESANKWRFSNTTSIVITYDPNLLEANISKPSILAQTQLAIQRTAYTVLAYMALKVICEQIDQYKSEQSIPLTLSMLRLQTLIASNADEESTKRMQGLYAIAHAVEHALGQHWRIRMQGLELNSTIDKQHQNRNTFNALLSVLPLRMETPQVPTINDIGVLSLISRPVTEHPELTQDTDKDFVLIGRSYHAKAVKDKGQSGYKLVANANLLALESGSDNYNNSTAIINAIERLYRNGCKHIIYMGQNSAWNQQRFFNTQYRYHFAPEFFASIEKYFPDLKIYPLTHDVFSATRLFKRGDNQDAFEVLNYKSHSDQSYDKSLIPIYSLATLHVVGNEDERPQSGFATYFLIRDDSKERLEQESRKRLDLIPTDSPIRQDIIAVLRGIHYLESETTNTKNKHVRPVLHPFSIFNPDNIAEVGEFFVHERKKTNKVILSLPAILSQVTKMLTIST